MERVMKKAEQTGFSEQTEQVERLERIESGTKRNDLWHN